jgi:nitrite reductase (NO-forming)/hydroxylamine reductase
MKRVIALSLSMVALLLSAAFAQTPPPHTTLTPAQMDEAFDIYFDRCSGCHGPTRQGATGPELTHDTLGLKGEAYIKAILYTGLPGGMPGWGSQGILNDEQMSLMAAYLLNPVPEPPLMTFDEIRESWNLIKPVDQRPTEPQTSRNWENYVGVILRDAGQVAIIDGDTKELVTLLDTGYAIHILRSSADGHYFQAVGRDGKASLIDLWTEVPEVVAEARPCLDARSIESSKMHGHVNDFVVEGCYWPPQFVIMDGLTLEPIKMVSTVTYERGGGERVDAARVAAIVASEHDSTWIINIKEAGQTWLVDYSKLNENGEPLTVTQLDTELYLHDGGWVTGGRYFVVAANDMNRLVVIDADKGTLEEIIDVAHLPHPGRGANWVDPEFGPVWATGHLGAPTLTLIGADPEGHPEHAWKVVRELEAPYTGNLFIKAHDNSPWLIADFPMSIVPQGPSTLCAWNKQDLENSRTCWEVEGAREQSARMVHIEFIKGGSEFWVSAWAPMDKDSFIVIYDAVTLEEIDRIEGAWLVTPTGKFNVFNTANDVY